MYSSQHQRTSSNPRAYAAPDASAVGGRRDDPTNQGIYTSGGDDGYSAYQQQQQQHTGGYGGMSNVGYGYNSNMNLAGYNAATSSPSAPSGSRRTSGPKLNTPPSQASTGAANSSPAARYYPTSQAQTADSASHHQSPYQPSSAPPQVLSHHHSSLAGQPQTAHPYASQYQHYYDQQNQHHQSSGQWANYPSSASHGYAQQSAQPRSSAATASSTTPTVSSSATLGSDSHQHSSHRAPPATSTSSSYDYPSAASYQSWPTHDQSSRASQSQQSWQHQQQSNTARLPQTQGNPQSMLPQGAWQGYNSHPSMPQTMPPHHMGSGHAPPGQYGWNQQQWAGQGYGYPPAPTQQPPAQPAPTAAPVPAPVAAPPAAAAPAPVSHKKAKKEKTGDDYKGLGKRAAEPVAEVEPEEKKESKKKKGKKEEEKPVHKAPAKSHLHPPRQAQSAWQLFFTDELNKAKATAAQGNSPGGTPHHAKLNVAQIAKDAGIAYASLNEEQRKYYAQKVQESKEQYARELAVWQATLTPEDIKAENAFRAQQRKEGKSRKGNLKDPNAPKKPLSAYFLFLKGIRENDDIRAKVWGEESETTKQSVLAAERWRSLSDEEKKPYLQQAEHDKQEYEAARKVYEEEAAARARGEDVPARAIIVPDVPPVSTDRPKPRKKKEEVKSDPVTTEVKPSPHSGEPAPSSDPTFPDFAAGDSHHSTDNTPAQVEGADFEPSMEIDDFHGFTDPLDDMEFTGLESIGATDSHEPQWDELQKLMGTAADDGFESKPAPASEKTVDAGVKAEGKPVGATEPPVETADLSVAPTLEEAKAETVEIERTEPTRSEASIVETAAAAEGELPVPSPILAESRPHSGVPTEDVSELLPADVPQVDDQQVASSAPELAPPASEEVPTESSSATEQPAIDGI
ncbi:hypothetical protein CI109_107279 [Kwoniella shandongensis]|uniref:Uncharacterized protein n=1 Tax=Kwoniella shandongensis TaxID=1734106 RepID=A0A5M6C398_9TREE|nr:uncharacterized protein CI109_002562 [Kwoniella shandongensis]KAA5529221.1 hypothetical protein CI109_002562 [Kwoniella shandongensis]